MRLTVLSFCLVLALAAVSGCGIKPKNVDAPGGTEKDTFPRTYPNPATDPQP
jgi:hypothetical protein